MRRRPEVALAGLVVLAAAVGVVVDQSVAAGLMPASASSASSAQAPRSDPSSSTSASRSRARGSTSTGTATAGLGLAAVPQRPEAADLGAPAAGTVPVHLVIPRIGVDVDLGDLTRAADGVLQPPAGLLEAGWYSGSAVPGAVGPAVIAGHVDDTEQAGIFARLHELAPGDEIVVRLSDGSERRFTVDGSLDVAKSEFPTESVYGATRDSQLRLITCNGPYDFGVMHYANNLVVSASAAPAA